MKRIRKPLLLSLMFVCGLSAGVGFGSTDTNPVGMKAAMAHSVSITGNPERFEEYVADCTATLFGKNAIITATHCLVNNPMNLIRVDGMTMRYLYRVDDGNDNSLVFFKRDTFLHDKYPEICQIRQKGVDVVSMGNPLGARNVVRKGTLITTLFHNDKVRLVYDVNIINGDSGSAFFDSQAGCIMSVAHQIMRHPNFKVAFSEPIRFTQAQMRLVQR